MDKEKELIKRIESCVYFKKELYCIREDEFDKSKYYDIFFNLPLNDLNKLMRFCKLNDLFIEYCNNKILITQTFDK